MKNAEKFKQIFGLYATELWSMPESDFLAWLNRAAETAQNVSDSDVISREAAIEALARMMPRSYTPDGSHPADEEIFRAQEVFAGCIEALEILPSAQPKRGKWIYGEDSIADGVDGYRCDQCGFFVPWDYTHKSIDYIKDYNFCPKCGSYNGGEQDG